jgi:hypothetical protein
MERRKFLVLLRLRSLTCEIGHISSEQTQQNVTDEEEEEEVSGGRVGL